MLQADRNIYALFPLGELLRLATRAVGCRKGGLFFLEPGRKHFFARFIEPDGVNQSWSSLVLGEHNPIIAYLSSKHTPLTLDNLAMLPGFRRLPESDRQEIMSTGMELWLPLINDGSLTGILVLDKKQSGSYSSDDLDLLGQFTTRIVTSMQETHSSARLDKHEKELSVINRSVAIINSSLDIQRTYDDFIIELKQAVDVSWSAITLIEENKVYFLALFSETDSSWRVGERIQIEGTAIEWLANHRKTVVESDLLQKNSFSMGKDYLKQGLCSVTYIPMIVEDCLIGSLIVASRNPNAYHQKHIQLLEGLTSQIAIPVNNSRLYARAEERARIDGLTGLLNRHSLDEILLSEISRHSRYGGVLSLIILDIDSMKTVNDSHGHPAGDKLISQFSIILKNVIRQSDYAFRYGGDEFAVLLPQTTIDSAMHVAERIRLQVSSSTKETIPTTASLGLAGWPSDGIGASEVIATADRALYLAKRSGGNRTQRYQSSSLISNYAVPGSPTDKNSEALSTVYFMAAAVDARDHYTGDHSRKVNKHAVALGKALELEPSDIERISACALLHDIGKVGISDEILTKSGKLTAEEWKVIKFHPQLGATIASHVRQLGPYIPGILYHHERYDGTGYPEGLKGEEIPLEARILAIADAYAAMTSDRCHSSALSHEQALAEIKCGAGTQFDPNLARVFLSIARAATPSPPRKRKSVLNTTT